MCGMRASGVLADMSGWNHRQCWYYPSGKVCTLMSFGRRRTRQQYLACRFFIWAEALSTWPLSSSLDWWQAYLWMADRVDQLIPPPYCSFCASWCRLLPCYYVASLLLYALSSPSTSGLLMQISLKKFFMNPRHKLGECMQVLSANYLREILCEKYCLLSLIVRCSNARQSVNLH